MTRHFEFKASKSSFLTQIKWHAGKRIMWDWFYALLYGIFAIQFSVSAKPVRDHHMTNNNRVINYGDNVKQSWTLKSKSLNSSFAEYNHLSLASFHLFPRRRRRSGKILINYSLTLKLSSNMAARTRNLYLVQHSGISNLWDWLHVYKECYMTYRNRNCIFVISKTRRWNSNFKMSCFSLKWIK